MPVHMGIMWERCRKVHFVATSLGIKPGPLARGMYLLTCRPPCPETEEFRKETMRPYRVEEAVFKTGYAEESECGLILSVLEGPAEPPKGRCEPSLTDPPTSTIRKIGRESSEVPTLNPSENKSGLERGDARH